MAGVEMNQSLFELILGIVSAKLKNEEKLPKIMKKLDDLFQSTAEIYRTSTDCNKLLTKCSEKLQQSSTVGETFLQIRKLGEELKAHQQKTTQSRRIVSTMVGACSSAETTTTNAESVVAEAEQQSSTSSNPTQNIPIDNSCTPAQLAKKAKEIKKMEQLARKLEKMIGIFGQKELDLADLDEKDDAEEVNAYGQLQKLEAKALRVQQKLRQLKNEKVQLGRPIVYSGSGYPLIDKAINRLIYGQGTSTKRLIGDNIPSQLEVGKVIEEIDKEHKLFTGSSDGLSEEEKENLIRKILNDLMMLLKKNTVAERRQFIEDYFESNPDAVDPATTDPNLLSLLEQNKNDAKQKAAQKLRERKEDQTSDEENLPFPEIFREELETQSNNDDGGRRQPEESVVEEQQQPITLTINDDDEEPPKKKVRSELRQQNDTPAVAEEEIIDISDSPPMTSADVVEIPDDD